MKLADVNLIIIHASDTPSSMDIGVKEIRKWHVEERHWNDIGYHFVIRRNGLLEEGRPLYRQGAHTLGHNRNSIGICLVGGKGGEADDVLLKHFTLAQQVTLLQLLHRLEMDISKAQHAAGEIVSEAVRITGHNEFARKACPCFNVEEWLDITITGEEPISFPSSIDWMRATLENAPARITKIQDDLEKLDVQIRRVLDELERRE